MIRRSMFRIVSVVLFAVLVTGTALAGAQEGLKLYTAHEFEDAIDAVKGGKDTMSKLVLGLSHHERYYIYKDKTDKERASMYLKLLKVDVSVKDVRTIEQFLAVSGNPNGNKVALGLLKVAFANARSKPEDILMMVDFIDEEKGAAVAKIALAALYKRLKPVRDYVSKGGSMPKDMKGKVFGNPKVIGPLVAALTMEKAESSARKCLAVIEEPSLELLEEQDLSEPISDAIVAVKKAIASRMKKHPDSSWYSADGE